MADVLEAISTGGIVKGAMWEGIFLWRWTAAASSVAPHSSHPQCFLTSPTHCSNPMEERTDV